jgi:Zn finger protein HypA/HybF involved in hydrogenase expression
MAGLPAVLWRCVEGKSLPLNIRLGARCPRCGCSIDVMFRLTTMETKPERMRCPLCRAHDLRLLSARAQVLRYVRDTCKNQSQEHC